MSELAPKQTNYFSLSPERRRLAEIVFAKNHPPLSPDDYTLKRTPPARRSIVAAGIAARNGEPPVSPALAVEQNPAPHSGVEAQVALDSVARMVRSRFASLAPAGSH